MVTCPKCGSQQPDGAFFCDACGAALDRPAAAGPEFPAGRSVAPMEVAASACPACGTEIAVEDRYCPNCGASLASRPAAGGRRPGPAPEIGGPPQVYLPASPHGQPPAEGAICHNCGARLMPHSVFCDMCGAPVKAAAPVVVPPPTDDPAPDARHPLRRQAQTIVSESPQAAVMPPVAVPGRLVLHSSHVSLPFPPGKSEIVIGRKDPISEIFPDLDLTDHGGEEGGVSRRHARIFLDRGQFHIEDLNSTNHTFLNREKLAPRQPYPLHDGDELRFGRVRATFRTA